MNAINGIVISKTKYTGNNVVLKVYTELEGIKAFIVSVNSKSNKFQKLLTQPMSLVSILCSASKGSLNRVKELNPQIPLSGIHADIRKTTITIFISEILNKTLAENDNNASIYQLIYSTIVSLNKEKFIPDFHLKFLAKLCDLSGFKPVLNYSRQYPFFNLLEGEFEKTNILGKSLNQKVSLSVFELFSSLSYQDVVATSTEKTVRNEVLNVLIDYVQIHFHINSKIKSKEILAEVFD